MSDENNSKTTPLDLRSNGGYGILGSWANAYLAKPSKTLATEREINMASKIDESNNTVHSENQKTKSVRLKDLLTEKVDFLKIDIEGAEYEVLIDCESKLSFVENLFIEYHGNYNEMYKLNKILNILIENNFKYYIKEAGVTFEHPFYDRENIYDFDTQLNIFAFKN